MILFHIWSDTELVSLILGLNLEIAVLLGCMHVYEATHYLQH